MSDAKASFVTRLVFKNKEKDESGDTSIELLNEDASIEAVLAENIKHFLVLHQLNATTFSVKANAHGHKINRLVLGRILKQQSNPTLSTIETILKTIQLYRPNTNMAHLLTRNHFLQNKGVDTENYQRLTKANFKERLRDVLVSMMEMGWIEIESEERFNMIVDYTTHEFKKNTDVIID
ncbi:hypothetical protein [Paraferrimonas sedimenticola]|uniref:Uncharacterized protein n=1 Tax=Paraferrimonas sedimenticola TaxID=375674 RepID=A0AA37VTC6_9GAMM|nr:hypothetical protein [Paraferrimonas sedimenticola]GLP95319.1 hypothetical protein GCM10007895_06250 [Paraferrimonas sedimenticola]